MSPADPALLSIAPIVEGHADVKAVPFLIRRIALEVDARRTIHVLPPQRSPRSLLVKAGELERQVEHAGRRLGGQGAVLVLIDADTDCPAQLGPILLRRAASARSDMAVAVVLAKCEYEAWFIAAIESLRGRRRISLTATAPPDPEGIQGAKGWISRQMPAERPYDEIRDQPALTELFDLAAARSCRSFDKCFREVVGLIRSTPSVW
jgi:hypothetical protein